MGPQSQSFCSALQAGTIMNTTCRFVNLPPLCLTWLPYHHRSATSSFCWVNISWTVRARIAWCFPMTSGHMHNFEYCMVLLGQLRPVRPLPCGGLVINVRTDLDFCK